METRANHVVVGLFTLAVLAGAFGFVYWLARYGDHGRKDAYEVVFAGSVAGLNRGSPVLFNGLRVGEVESLSLDPRNPQVVRARVRVDAGTPVRKDTRAQLEMLGLAGGSALALTGGSPDGPPPESRDGVPVIRAERSGFQDLVAGAQTVLGKMDDAVTRIGRLVESNEAAVGNTLRNSEVLTRNLAESSAKIGGAVDNASEFFTAMKDMAGPARNLVERLDRLAGAVDPDAVSETLGNVRTFSGSLARNTEQVDRLVKNAGDASEKLNALLDGASGLGDTAKDVAAKAGAAIERVDRIARAVDPDKISRAVDGIATVSETLAQKSDRIGRFIDEAGTVATRLGAALEGSEGLGRSFKDVAAAAQATIGDVDRLAKAVDPEKLGRAVDNITAFSDMLAKRGDQIGRVVDHVASLSDTLAQKRDRIGRFIDEAGAAAARLGAALEGSEGLGRNINELAATAQGTVNNIDRLARAVDPDKLGRTVDNVSAFADTLAANRDGVERMVKNLDAASTRLSAALEGSEGLGQSVKELTAAALGTIRDIERLAKAIDAESLSKTVGNVQTLTDTLAGKSDEVGRIVDDAASLARKLNGTADRLDKILANAESFFGGGESKGMITEMSEAARSFRKLADDLQPKLSATAENISRFSGRGLKDIETFVADGRRTLSSFERVITNLERNPQRFIAGGSRVPEFNPRR